MGRKKSMILLSVVTLGLVVMAMIPVQTRAQEKSPCMKIGTYDSRIVTLAWSRGDLFKQYMTSFGQQSDSAKKANDSVRIKELSVHAMMFQHLLHQMVFSSGSIGFIMEKVKDKLPELAKKSGVSLILSKWELTYFKDTEIEVVDLTKPVYMLFEPKEDIEKMAAEMDKIEPVPLNELDIEAEMLDSYCRKFGKK